MTHSSKPLGAMSLSVDAVAKCRARLPLLHPLSGQPHSNSENPLRSLPMIERTIVDHDDFRPIYSLIHRPSSSEPKGMRDHVRSCTGVEGCTIRSCDILSPSPSLFVITLLWSNNHSSLPPTHNQPSQHPSCLVLVTILRLMRSLA